MIVLDTNVISEVLRPVPDEQVMAWMRAMKRSELWTCSIVLAELYAGVELMPAGKRKQTLREKMDQLVSLIFAEKVLGFDGSAARKYGEIFAARQRLGRPIQEIDAQIAAIAAVHGAALATRNIPDFKGCGVRLINPW
jgi:hypothetical protein